MLASVTDRNVGKEMISSTGYTNSIAIPNEPERHTEEFLSLDELKHLIQLLDQSDVAELEVRATESQARLVLRKAKPQEDYALQEEHAIVEEVVEAKEDLHYTVVSPHVGTFRSSSHTHAGNQPLVTIGENVKQGQHIGMIQSLNILNEVEIPVPGKIIEILVKDGQPIEYGQPLMVVEKQ